MVQEGSVMVVFLSDLWLCFPDFFEFVGLFGGLFVYEEEGDDE